MIKELFFPSECVFCKLICNQFVCKNCVQAKLDIEYKLSKEVKGIEYLIYFVDFRGAYKQMIYRGKYKFDKQVWQFIGENISRKIQFKPNSFLTYVPISWFRYCFRGFNQSKLIAENVIGVDVLGLLKRIGGSYSISKSNKKSRIETMKRSLNLGKKYDLSSYKYCYLVDDVYTSGATMQAAAKLIQSEYPHLKVIGLCFAKTPLNS